MLLSLLLAAIDDAMDGRARRAALHEAKQRLFPVKKKLGPSIGESLIAAYREIILSAKSISELVSLRNALYGFITPLVGREKGWVTLPVHTLLGPVEDKLRLTDSIRLFFPAKDHQAILLSYGGKAPFIPVLRTEFDPMIAFIFRVYGEGPAPFGEYKAAYIQSVLPSMRDWFLEVHPDLSSMTWLEAVAASAVWHASFNTVGFGDPVPAALIVLRFPDRWTLQRLTEKADLAKEGSSMAHCVGGPDRGGYRDGDSGYWQDVRDDQSVILSLRGPDGVPKATVEMQREDGKVVQIQGPLDQDMDEDAQRHLIQAFWAFPVFPSQKDVHRIGNGGVWTDGGIVRLATSRHVISGVRDIHRAYLAWKKGYLVDADFESELYALERDLMRSLSRTAHEISGNIQHPVRDETKLIRPRALSASADYIGNIFDPTLIPDGNAIPERVLSVYWFGAQAWFVVSSLDGERVDYMGPNVATALRAYTLAPSEPPSLDGLEAFPGLPFDPTRTNWKRLLCPVEEARALRRVQSSRAPAS